MKFEIYQKYYAKYFEEHIALRIIVRLGTDKDECYLTKGNQQKKLSKKDFRNVCDYQYNGLRYRIHFLF